MNERLWILGAPDPEMEAIEKLLTGCGEAVEYAETADGRVHPGNAYKATDLSCTAEGTRGRKAIWVECGTEEELLSDPYDIHVDHHRPGDPGYGQPPEKFMAATSLGQVLSRLAQLELIPETWKMVSEYGLTPGEVFQGRLDDKIVHWVSAGPRTLRLIPSDLVLAAAADHCLSAAYRGACPGVDPDELMAWRVASRAAFQKRPAVCRRCGDIQAIRWPGYGDLDLDKQGDPIPGGMGLCGDLHHWMDGAEQIMRDISSARERLRDAVSMSPDHPGDIDWEPGLPYADLRGQHIPELPEAACREGIPFVASMTDRDGREKVVLQAAPEDLVRKFLAGEIVSGLGDTYGDPARGFAGGYIK